jgi:hypothetical protein
MLVQVGLEYRYMPPVAKLIEIVKGGNLGRVKMVAIREHRFPFLVKVYNATLSMFTVWKSILQTYACDRSTIGTGSMLTQGEHW